MGIFDRIKGLFGQKKAVAAGESFDGIEDATTERLKKLAEAHENRKIYKVLTVANLDETPDELLVEVVWDNLQLKLHPDFSNESEVVATFSLSRKAIWQIWLLEAEVNNGGFIQFFDNSSGEYAGDLPDSLRLIGATKFAELVDCANDRRAAYLAAFSEGTKTEDDWYESMEGLDAAFYDLYNEEPLGEIQVAFIRRNKEAFADR